MRVLLGGPVQAEQFSQCFPVKCAERFPLDASVRKSKYITQRHPNDGVAQCIAFDIAERLAHVEPNCSPDRVANSGPNAEPFGVAQRKPVPKSEREPAGGAQHLANHAPKPASNDRADAFAQPQAVNISQRIAE